MISWPVTGRFNISKGQVLQASGFQIIFNQLGIRSHNHHHICLEQWIIVPSDIKTSISGQFCKLKKTIWCIDYSFYSWICLCSVGGSTSRDRNTIIVSSSEQGCPYHIMNFRYVPFLNVISQFNLKIKTKCLSTIRCRYLNWN